MTTAEHQLAHLQQLRADAERTLDQARRLHRAAQREQLARNGAPELLAAHAANAESSVLHAEEALATLARQIDEQTALVAGEAAAEVASAAAPSSP